MDFDWGSIGDWGSQYTPVTTANPKWLDDLYSGGVTQSGTSEYTSGLPEGWSNAGADLSNYSDMYLGGLGGDFSSGYGDPYQYTTPTSPAGTTSWESALGAGAGKVAEGVANYGIKNAVPIGMGLLGAGLQGSADKDASELAKRLREARAQGATNYMGALQTGKEEAKSSYLQNLAAQKSSLANKLAQNTADSGGANPRRTMDKFTRSGNAGYGNFLLNLAQSKTPDLAAFTQQLEGTVPAEDWWTGTKRGAASTLGTTLANQQNLALLNSIYGNRS